MNGITTSQLGILENSFDYLEDLPKHDIRCVEFVDEDGISEDYYFKNEENAKNKFNELVKKHGLKIR